MTDGGPVTGAGETCTATLGGGCFWCLEAVFQQLDGVTSVESGFAGGWLENPTYERCCDGDTGHAEVCQITFDPRKISFADLLQVFFKIHDPTTLDRQGKDVGPQYRSIILHHDDEQKRIAGETRRVLDLSGAYDAPIVTEIAPYTCFYRAPDYHQNYFRRNGAQPYCQVVIRPKVEKFRAAFSRKLAGST